MDQLTYRSGKWDIINVTLNNNILIYCAAHRAQAQISIRGSHCQYNDFTVSPSPSHSQQADGPCSLLCIHEVDFMLLKFEIRFGIVIIFQSSVIVFQHEKAAWVFLSLGWVLINFCSFPENISIPRPPPLFIQQTILSTRSRYCKYPRLFLPPHHLPRLS